MQAFERCTFTDVILTSVINMLEGHWRGCVCCGRLGLYGGWGGLCGFGGVAAHVFLQGALVAESAVACRGFLVEEAVASFFPFNHHHLGIPPGLSLRLLLSSLALHGL